MSGPAVKSRGRVRARWPPQLREQNGLELCGSFPFLEIASERAGNGTITGLVAGNGRTEGVRFERRSRLSDEGRGRRAFRP